MYGPLSLLVLGRVCNTCWTELDQIGLIRLNCVQVSMLEWHWRLTSCMIVNSECRFVDAMSIYWKLCNAHTKRNHKHSWHTERNQLKLYQPLRWHISFMTVIRQTTYSHTPQKKYHIPTVPDHDWYQRKKTLTIVILLTLGRAITSSKKTNDYDYTL